MYRYFAFRHVCGHVCIQSLRNPEEGTRCSWNWIVSCHVHAGTQTQVLWKKEEQPVLLRADPSLHPVIPCLVADMWYRGREWRRSTSIKSSCFSSKGPEFSSQLSCLAAHECHNSRSRGSETLFFTGTCTPMYSRMQAHILYTQEWKTYTINKCLILSLNVEKFKDNLVLKVSYRHYIDL